MDYVTSTSQAAKTEVEQLRLERDLYKNKFKQAESAYQQLLYNFKQLQRDKFGRKSERYIDSNLLTQGDLFAEFFTDEEIPNLEADKDEQDVVNVTSHKRRKQKNKFADNLPRREVIIKAKDRICSCGLEKKLIRYEETEILNYIPEVFEVIVQKREVLGCSCGCAITTAPVPPKVLPKVSVTASMISHVIVSKLHDRQPLYHLETSGEEVFSAFWG